MKEYMIKRYQTISLIITIMLLQACGGSSTNDTANKYQINADNSNVSFSSEVLQVSEETIQIKVTFQGNGLLLGFAPNIQPAAWLEYRTENVTSNTATIHIDVTNAELLPPDTYTTTLRLSTGDVSNINLVHHDIDISLLIWQLSTDTNLISFAGTLGDETISAQSFNIISELNEWTATSDVNWLTLDVNSGTGSDNITVTPDITSFSNSGLNQANIILTETSSGDTKLLPVELGLDNIYLYADNESIAFTSTNNINNTQQIININSNAPSQVNWQANNDAEWLAITKTNNQLTLTVDENLLIDNQLVTTAITISAVDNSAIIAETIKVSFYKNDSDIVDQIIPNTLVNSNALINSPTLPYVYIGVENELRVYHQYTGELLHNIAIAPEGELLEQLIVHPNGNMLLAKTDDVITSSDGSTRTDTTRYQVNLTDLTFTELTNTDIAFEPLNFIRLHGRYFVVTQALEYADENLITQLVNTDEPFATNFIDVAQQTNSLFAIDNNSNSIKRFNFVINDFVNEKLSSTQTHDYQPTLNVNNAPIQALSVSNNGSNIYIINETSEWLSFDGIDFTDNGLVNSNDTTSTLALVSDNKGVAYFTSFNADTGFFINSYSGSELTASTPITSNNQPESISISSDSNRAIISSGIINSNNFDNVEFISLSQ